METGKGRESFSGWPLSIWLIVARKRLPTPWLGYDGYGFSGFIGPMYFRATTR